MTDVSPAAQAVLDAFYGGGGQLERLDRFARYEERVAAALRAAASQVVPPDQSCSLDELKVWCRLRNLADKLDGGAQ